MQHTSKSKRRKECLRNKLQSHDEKEKWKMSPQLLPTQKCDYPRNNQYQNGEQFWSDAFYPSIYNYTYPDFCYTNPNHINNFLYPYQISNCIANRNMEYNPSGAVHKITLNSKTTRINHPDYNHKNLSKKNSKKVEYIFKPKTFVNILSAFLSSTLKDNNITNNTNKNLKRLKSLQGSLEDLPEESESFYENSFVQTMRPKMKSVNFSTISILSKLDDHSGELCKDNLHLDHFDTPMKKDKSTSFDRKYRSYAQVVNFDQPSYHTEGTILSPLSMPKPEITCNVRPKLSMKCLLTPKFDYKSESEDIFEVTSSSNKNINSFHDTISVYESIIYKDIDEIDFKKIETSEMDNFEMMRILNSKMSGEIQRVLKFKNIYSLPNIKSNDELRQIQKSKKLHQSDISFLHSNTSIFLSEYILYDINCSGEIPKCIETTEIKNDKNQLVTLYLRKSQTYSSSQGDAKAFMQNKSLKEIELIKNSSIYTNNSFKKEVYDFLTASCEKEKNPPGCERKKITGDNLIMPSAKLVVPPHIEGMPGIEKRMREKINQMLLGHERNFRNISTKNRKDDANPLVFLYTRKNKIYDH